MGKITAAYLKWSPLLAVSHSVSKESYNAINGRALESGFVPTVLPMHRSAVTNCWPEFEDSKNVEGGARECGRKEISSCSSFNLVTKIGKKTGKVNDDKKKTSQPGALDACGEDGE